MLEPCLNGLLKREEFKDVFQGCLFSGYCLCLGTCKLKANEHLFFLCLTEVRKAAQTKGLLQSMWKGNILFSVNGCISLAIYLTSNHRNHLKSLSPFPFAKTAPAKPVPVVAGIHVPVCIHFRRQKSETSLFLLVSDRNLSSAVQARYLLSLLFSFSVQPMR